MVLGCVYLVTNTVNGKAYIGKSISGLTARRKTHFSAARKGQMQPFICALRKHGEAAFDWREIFLSDDNAALLIAEMALVADYRSAGVIMYNATNGGEGVVGRKMSDAARKKLRDRTYTPEQIERFKASWTPERRAHIAAIVAARPRSDASNKKISDKRKGIKFTPEHCEAIRLSKLGNTYRKGTGQK